LKPHLEKLLPKWQGARVSHPQQPELPDERTKFQRFLSCRVCCGWDSRAPPPAKTIGQQVLDAASTGMRLGRGVYAASSSFICGTGVRQGYVRIETA
jgi:hypothetical protein